MIRLRIDDVMVESSGLSREKSVRQIHKIHRWACQALNKVIHIPTIVVDDMKNWPDVTEFLRIETEAGRMSPQLHGFQHIDYAKLSLSEIEDHLERSILWFRKELSVEPSVWATPWGGKNETMEEAAKKFCLEIETTEKTINPGKAVTITKTYNPMLLDGHTIFAHWWERGLNILRFIEVLNRGSYEKAKEARPDLF